MYSLDHGGSDLQLSGQLHQQMSAQDAKVGSDRTPGLTGTRDTSELLASHVTYSGITCNKAHESGIKGMEGYCFY